MLRFYVGKTGSGKTYLAIAEALRLAKKHKVKIHTNIAIKSPLVAKHWDFADPQIFAQEHCITVMDEMGLTVNARNYQKTPQQASDFAILNRKQDVFAHCTVQSLKYVDVMYREQDFEVWLPSRRGLPFMGWLFPWSRVRTKLCACGRVPWDVKPDDRGWRKWLGFGTYFWVPVFRLSDLSSDGKVSAAQAGKTENPQEGFSVIRPPAPRRIRMFVYDQNVADAYDTHANPRHAEPETGAHAEVSPPTAETLTVNALDSITSPEITLS